MDLTRRTLLGAVAGGASAVIAGCVDGTDDGPESGVQSRLPADSAGCPAYDGVDRFVCYDAVDPESVPAVLEPAARTVAEGDTIEFTLRNQSDVALSSNFYNWRLHKHVDGDWYHVAPFEYNEPLMTLSPGETHTWTVSIDNGGIANGEPVPSAGGTERLDVCGLGGGQYAFRARGWFEGGSYEQAVAFGATFELDAPPIALTTTNAIESTEWDGETLVATSTRGDRDGSRPVFELREVDDPGGETESIITEQILRQSRVRDAIALAVEYDADRVRLEAYDAGRPIFRASPGDVYEFQGSYYEISSTGR